MTQTPRTTSSRQPQSIKPSLSSITSRGGGLPNRYIIHAVEGFGKTSFGAQFPKPIFLETRGETGLETLIDAGQLAEVPHFPEVPTWEELLGNLDALLSEEHDYKTLNVDAVNGAERLCHEFVCHRDFEDNWGDKGFASYQKGPEVALSEWRLFLSKLDRLRVERKMTIVCLCHTKVAAFRNPEGADYDRYQPDIDKRTWSLTAKWADVVLFGNFDTTVTAVKENKKTGEQKGKGAGGQSRVMYTQRHAAYDAKNRLGLPPDIDMGSSVAEGFANFVTALKAGRSQSNGQ
jgi:hypothetical protein